MIYTPTKLAEIRSWTKDCATWLEARAVVVKRLGIHQDNATKSHKRHIFWVEPEGTKPNPHTPDITTTARGDGFDAEVELSKAATLEEVVKICGVDTDRWESKGFSVRRGTKGYAWSARFVKRQEVVDFTVASELFKTATANHSPRKWVHAKPSQERDCLYVLNLQDLHLSKLAWHRESGADYDINLAKQAYKDAIKDLMFKAPCHRIEEVLMIAGSDYFQSDTDKSTTTAGTYVDSDGRLAKAFEEGCALLTDTAEMLAEKYKVKIVVIPGNHDEQTSQFMGCYLSAWFRHHPNITIDNEPKSRKYHAYGKVLLGLVHGHREKLKDLPLIMMRENQARISSFKYQEWLTGHRHIEQTDEMHGIKVRTCNALCAPDQWHFAQGYVGTLRTSQGLLYNKTHGLEAIFYSTPID